MVSRRKKIRKRRRILIALRAVVIGSAALDLYCTAVFCFRARYLSVCKKDFSASLEMTRRLERTLTFSLLPLEGAGERSETGLAPVHVEIRSSQSRVPSH